MQEMASDPDGPAILTGVQPLPRDATRNDARIKSGHDGGAGRG
jgi:hypothetical protein